MWAPDFDQEAEDAMPEGELGAEDEEEEEFCIYCGEPLEDGLCSDNCPESAADEGRDEEE